MLERQHQPAERETSEVVIHVPPNVLFFSGYFMGHVKITTLCVTFPHLLWLNRWWGVSMLRDSHPSSFIN